MPFDIRQSVSFLLEVEKFCTDGLVWSEEWLVVAH